MIESRNPATGEVTRRFEEHSPVQIELALQQAKETQRVWSKTDVRIRCQLLTAVARVFRKSAGHYASLITLEMGKTIVEAEAEIDKCAFTCDFYAKNAEQFLSDESVKTNGSESYVVFDPLGVVLAIMPWNYPFWQAIRFAAPALAAGNGVILKHANNVPQCAMALEQILHDAGAPKGLFISLLVDPASVKSILEDDRITAVTLTGSTAVGKLVASQAGKLLKKQVLELGGSDPFIVLADADIDAAAKAATLGRFQNSGQSCISSKRFIVEDAIGDKFVRAFRAQTELLRIGNPMDRTVDLGPMARADLRDSIALQVKKSVAQGATLVSGGQALEGPGYFYAPTILDHVCTKMAAACEETFGPLAAVIRFKDVDEAIAVANATEFGLGASIWTANIRRAKSLVRSIEAGTVFINGVVASDPRLPFGGIKQSGYGRELGIYGIREFTNIKTVWIGPKQ